MNTPLVLVFPGLSLMEITPTTDGVEVRCPGCDAVQHFAADRHRTAGSMQSAAFVHEDGCHVHARIEQAMRLYERRVVRHG